MIEYLTLDELLRSKMKTKIPKKKAIRTMNKRYCGYWNCGYELRRDWVSKKFGFPEKKEAYDTLKEAL